MNLAPFRFFKRYTRMGEYIPVILVGLLFVAEEQLRVHALHISCQLAITIVCAVLFFTVLFYCGTHKYTAFAITLFLWVILVYLKNTYMPSRA
jgi:uncharacterized membrane protein YecN with MAPEG domain